MLILKTIKGGIKDGTLKYKVKGGTDVSEEGDNFDIFDDDDDDDDDDEGLMV